MQEDGIQFFFFETKSLYITWAGLEFMILLPLPPDTRVTGMHHHAQLHQCPLLYLDLDQELNYFVLSYRIPDLQFNLFSINVDHTSSKLHACQ
jgi:hypothetical protein